MTRAPPTSAQQRWAAEALGRDPIAATAAGGGRLQQLNLLLIKLHWRLHLHHALVPLLLLPQLQVDKFADRDAAAQRGFVRLAAA
jgi:hypothetical protein